MNKGVDLSISVGRRFVHADVKVTGVGSIARSDPPCTR